MRRTGEQFAPGACVVNTFAAAVAVALWLGIVIGTFLISPWLTVGVFLVTGLLYLVVLQARIN